MLPLTAQAPPPLLADLMDVTTTEAESFYPVATASSRVEPPASWAGHLPPQTIRMPNRPALKALCDAGVLPLRHDCSP